MEAFAWLGQIIEALGRIIPRLVIIRATHSGVRWRMGSYVSEMPPGCHVYWPLTTEIEVIVTARQTINLPTQVLMTADRQQIVIGTMVVYRIRDVVEAIGKKNWDTECTISDITQAAVVETITRSKLDDLLTDITAQEKKLTQTTRKRLRQFGVHVQRCAITDFSVCKTYKLIGNEAGPNHRIPII
jgi:regulator of protease activity HflC (stomatin/prohibitin superfamily)